MKALTIAATVENIEVVTDFVNELLEQAGCPMKIQTQIDVAIDELMSNIARYAYYPDKGNATVQVEFEEEPSAVVITFIDQGMPHNPLAKRDPDITLAADEREIGGLGIYLVKKSMDEVVYRYEEGRNILSIRKKIGQ